MNCKECDEEMGKRGDNHKYCTECISRWHIDNEIPDDMPNGDWDEMIRGEE